MTTFQLYWLTRLDGINSALVFGFAGGISAIVLIVLFGHMYADLNTDTKAEEKEVKASVWRTVRILGIIAALSGAALIFVPTTKELVAIYGISYLTQNKDAREIPAAALKVLNKQLQDLADDEKEDKD